MIAMFVLLMQTLWLYIDDIAGKGLGFFLVMELLAYKCVSLIPLALPIAVLISSVMVMGNLAEFYELSSFKSAGVSLLRVMRPIVIFGFFTTAFSYYCSNYLMPIANLKFGSRMYDIQRQKPALRLDAGVFNYDFQGYAIHIGKKMGDGRHIKKVLIYDHTEKNNNAFSQIMAEEGEMFAAEDGRYFVMNLRNGHQYIETRPTQSGNGKYPFVRTSFKRWTKVFDLSEFQLSRTDEELFKSNRSMLTIDQLYEAVDSLDKKIKERADNFSGTVPTYFYFLQPDSVRLPKTVVQASTPDMPPPTLSDGQGQQAAGSAIPTATGGAQAGADVSRPGDSSSFRRRLKTPWGQELKKELSERQRLDTVTVFGNAYKHLPVYEQKRLYSKAETAARSVQNQADGAVTFLQDLMESRVKHMYDLHTKYSMAVVCFIFIFIGAPMGAIIRKGGFGYPILVSIIFFMLFVILTIFCRKIAETNIIPTTVAAWIPNSVLFPIGLLLTVKAMNDSRFINTDRITEWFNRVFRRKQAQS